MPVKAKTGSNQLIMSPEQDVKRLPVASYDVSKVCRAIANHETHSCQDKTNFTAVNNCTGIKSNGKPQAYKTQAASYRDCEYVWSNFYGRLPDMALAQKWSGNDRAETWLNNVISYYLNT